MLIVSASIGSGHVAAGRALEGAFAALGAEVLHVDLLDFTTAPFRRLYRQTYFDLVRSAPDFVDWLGKRLDRVPAPARRRGLHVRARLMRLISYHLPRTIDSYRPSQIVHTHFLSPEVLSTRIRRLRAPQSVVVTDFAAHSLWLQPGVARYFVACEEVRVHLEWLGQPGGSIRVSGIPIDERFGHLPGKASARNLLGLPPDRDLLLVMAGGMSPQVLRNLLAGLLRLRLHLHVIVVCGRSPALVQVARDWVAEAEGPVTFAVRGFSEEVSMLMAAADLLIGKPGGLTTSEAMAAHLPFAVLDPYPLQEEANANYLLEQGAGMRIEPLSTLGLKLNRFFAESERRRTMCAAAKRISTPNAAFAVANDLLENSPAARRDS